MVNKDRDVFAITTQSEPVVVYRKTHPARLAIRVLNPFTGQPEDAELKGLGRDAGCFIELYSQQEKQYFEKYNKIALERGDLVEDAKPRDIGVVKSENNLSDDEIEELVNKKFLGLKAVVDRMTSLSAVARVVEAAERADKPSKTLEYLRAKLSLLELGEEESDASSE